MPAWLPSNLAPVEIAVLSILLDEPTEPFSTIRRQLAFSTVNERDLTGAGFFRDFVVPSSAPVRRDLPDSEIGGIVAAHPELECGAGFILFIRNGVVSSLEGFAYGPADWPMDEDLFTFVVQ